jgi:hypothetical protein
VRSPRESWAAWRRASRGDRRATLTAITLIPLFSIALRLFRLPSVLAWASRAARKRIASEETSVVVSEAVLAIERAARFGPYGGNCLSRSLTLIRLLRVRGVTPELRLGARKVNGQFEAHAWVECDGVVLNDESDVAVRFSAFPPPDGWKLR